MKTEFTITVEQVEDFEFRVRFDKPHHAELILDEPAPLGKDQAPNASRILAAAIGNCLSASLLFCTRRGKVDVGPIQTRVHTEIMRTEQGRLRIAAVNVEIDPNISEENHQRALRCLDLFEDFCTVTQSVRAGIPVKVVVKGFEEDLTQLK
jgi:uncharacterized OsmC-like protein